MKKTIYIFLIAISIKSQSQVSIQTVPYGIENDISNLSIPVITTIEINRDALTKQDMIDDSLGKPYRFGDKINVDYDFFQHSNAFVNSSGQKIYILKIKTKDAISINFIFNRFHLVGGSVMHIYNIASEQSLGGFSALNNKGTFSNPGKFGTGLVYGNEVIIEYQEPKDISEKSIINIGSIIYGYRSINIPIKYRQNKNELFGESGDCHININCSEGLDWQDEKKGVAMIIVGGNRKCTGSLLNNTSNNGDLLFLTADHCLKISETDIRDAETNSNCDDFSFWWNYESPVCSNLNTEPTASITNGATLIANNNSSDFALLRLSESPNSLNPPANAYFNGWSRTNSPTAGGVGIHHPKGDVKKISLYDITPISNTVCHILPNNFWGIKWIEGINGDFSVTDHGSSGSPLFQNDGNIIGQLLGPNTCFATFCENPSFQNVVYGRISVSWDNGTSAQRRLKDWLDPISSNVTSMSGGYQNLCTDNLTLTQNLTNTKLYQSKINLECSSILINPANIELSSENSITLKDGFYASAGTSLLAHINPCNNTVSPLVFKNYTQNNVIDNSSLINIYPNPVVDILQVPQNANSISIYDNKGLLLYEYNINISQINVSNLPSGLYIIKFIANNELITKRFVKQ